MDKKLNFINLLEKYRDNPALIWRNGEITYHQYFQYIKYVSSILKREGIQSGSKVVVISEINHHFPILFFAVLISGGTVIPINPKFPVKKIHTLIKEIDCDLVISFDESFSPDPKNMIALLSGNSIFEIFSEKNISDDIPSLTFEKNATIVFTSGTLGNPRGVLHTIGNHYFSAIGSNQNIALDQTDCWLITLPFYHIAGIAILFRTLIAGAACFIPDNAKDFSYCLKNNNVTHLSLVSTQLRRWLANNTEIDSASSHESRDAINHVSTLKSLKAILLGGSQIPLNLIEQALQRELPVFTSYGSTEMSSQITTTSGEDLAKNPASSGKILSHRELKIDNNGEILVRGKTLAQGYFFGEDIINFVDTYGWFHTGDLGLFDDNKNLVVTGRRDNMFVSGGENIHPEEIERHLQIMKNISEVCVVDVPDAEYGARPVAFIRMNSNYKIDEPQIRRYLEDKIEGYKIPQRFLNWPEDLDKVKRDRGYLRELAISLISSEFK